jgi:pimeloyl-ACP methyl ester carboxylesterase
LKSAVVITGSADTIVSPGIHSHHFAKTVPGAKLIVLLGVGHMAQNAAADLIIGEIENMILAVDTKPKAASR